MKLMLRASSGKVIANVVQYSNLNAAAGYVHETMRNLINFRARR